MPWVTRSPPPMEEVHGSHRAPRSQKKKRSEWFCSIIVTSCIAPSSAAFLVRVRLRVQQHLLQLFQRNNLSSVSGSVWTCPPSRTWNTWPRRHPGQMPKPPTGSLHSKGASALLWKTQTPDRGSSFLQDVSTISLFQSSPTARGRGWEQEPETLPPHREAGHPRRIYWA